MTPAEYATFHDTKGHVRDNAEDVDTDVLNGLAARRGLMVARGKDIAALDAQIDKALDPNDLTEMGVRKNMNKSFADFKTMRGITLKEKTIK
jgi:hypothetical protein